MCLPLNVPANRDIDVASQITTLALDTAFLHTKLTHHHIKTEINNISLPDDAYNYDGYDDYGGAVERPENTILPVYEREEDSGGQAVDYDYNDNYNNNYEDAGYDDNYNEPEEDNYS